MTLNNNPSPTKRLFIGSLPYTTSESDLLKLFVSEGKVIDTQIIRDPKRYSRGYGYVEYERLEDAIQAKEKYHNFELEGRSIIVDFSRPDPYQTEDGQKRHEEALKNNPAKFAHRFEPKTPKPQKKFKNFDENLKSKFKGRIRQSVYDSRAHGSGVGKKFSRRTQAR